MTHTEKVLWEMVAAMTVAQLVAPHGSKATAEGVSRTAFNVADAWIKEWRRRSNGEDCE